MKIDKLEIPLKILWIGSTIFSVYIFSWFTFFTTFGILFKETNSIFNVLLPNIVSIGIVMLHTKEIVIGYRPASYRKNLISLSIFSVIILVLILLQIPQFEFLFGDSTYKYWEITITYMVILASYLGIIMNRILKMKELNKSS
ncbi:hypothetical protein [uncultured Tenacibaculum sp.]|uniref:hypothetical protein n=1 Tax=uncultured Tenacibaculum sp. TaxID=174713 RepID=UPI00260A5F8C|nr:hypothetical protein [uncultured Tenacibaculum sp.]